MTPTEGVRAAPARTVQIVELSIIEDSDDQFCVGRPETGEFVMMPRVGVDLIHELRSGRTVGEAAEHVRAQHGEEPDLADFLETLDQLGFLLTEPGAVEPVSATSRGIALLGGLTPAQCRWLLSPVVTTVAVLAWSALPLLLFVGGHVPTAADALVYPNVLVLLVVFVPVAWSLLCLHELAHSLVARALGCPARTRFGNRLWNLVCETDLSSVYSLPRRRRFRPLLAGVTFDAVVLDVALVVQTVGLDWRPARIVAYMLFSGLVFQACIFMRTDLYFVATTLTRMDNLVRHARAEAARLVHWPRRDAAAGEDLDRLPRRQRWLVRSYLLGCLAGLVLGGLTFARVTLPATLGALAVAGHALVRGPAVAEFWAAWFVVLFIAAVYVLLTWTYVRNRRERSSWAAKGTTDVSVPVAPRSRGRWTTRG